MNSGRYVIYDQKSGRKFTIEPIAERHQKIDGHVFKNGGISGDEIKNDQTGGAIREEDSVITKENGYTNIVMLPPGTSPAGFIEALLSSPEKEKQLLEQYAVEE